MKTLSLSEKADDVSFKDVYSGVCELSEKYELWNRSERARLGLLKSFIRGRIETYKEHGNVVAFVESWRVSKEKVPDILAKKFDLLTEPVEEGPVLWIAAVVIDYKYRHRTEIIKSLKKRVMEKNSDADYVGGAYAGTRLRKRKYKLIPMRKKVV